MEPEETLEFKKKKREVFLEAKKMYEEYTGYKVFSDAWYLYVLTRNLTIPLSRVPVNMSSAAWKRAGKSQNLFWKCVCLARLHHGI